MLAGEDDGLVLRFPPTLTELPDVLAQSSRDVLVADALVYWDAQPKGLVAQAPTATGLSILRGTALAPTLEEVVRATFAQYPNHYSVNRLFPPDRVLTGYVEWASRAAESDRVAVLRDGEDVVGFVTWITDPDLGHLEIELAGLVPRARGRGAYPLLLADAGRTALEQGLSRVVISTQSGNVRVQRAWSRLGMLPIASFTTVHAVRPGLLGAERPRV
jgi:hypothetical protein